MKTFRFRIEGIPAFVALYSLEEYEMDGGIFDDTGNGGERFEESERDQFVCAAAIPYNETMLSESDVLEESGVKRTDYWHDSITDYFLLREWPEKAPYESRFIHDWTPSRLRTKSEEA